MKIPRIDWNRVRALAVLRDRILHMSGRQRRVARWAGMVLLAIVSFLVALRFAFPYERMKDKLVESLRGRYDVTVGDVGGGFLPGVIVFEDVVLRARPESPGEKAKEIVLDRLVVDLGLDFGLIGALRKKAVFDIDAELGGGEIEAEVELSSSIVEAHVETEDLALANVPGVAAAVGLPMAGSLDADIDLRLPGGKWKNAEGHVSLDCDDCTVGDGVSKMSMTPSGDPRRRRTSAAAAAWGAQGVTVPRLSLGDAEVVVDIKKGVGDIKSFSATSKDGWLKIEGKIEFRDPFPNTLFPGCMRFKLSDELKQRAPDFGNIEYTLSEKVRQADGSFAIPTKGKLTELRWDVRRKCGGGSTEEEGEVRLGERGFGRPSLDVGTPPQGGMPVEPSQVPGVSGVAQGQPVQVLDDAAAAARAAVTGEVPQPGTSGPPIAPNGGPGRDAGPVQGMAPAPPPEQGVVPPGSTLVDPPPPPPASPSEDNAGELRRIVPDNPPEQGDVQAPPPPPQPAPNEQGAEARPPDNPAPQSRDPEDRGVD